MTARILAVANQKGGVGKTTTAINLATALAALNKPVLLIDLDPQANATTGVGGNPYSGRPGTYQLLSGDCTSAEALSSSLIPNLSLLAGSADLSGAEIELVNRPQREFCLRNILSDCINNFEYVVIDCPPALGLLTLNALITAQRVLIPLQCEYYALEGLSQLLRTINRVQSAFNARLELLGVLLTMFDRRNMLNVQVADDVRRNLKEKVFDIAIPRNVRLSEAPSHGKPALVYDVGCLGSQAYIKFTSEFLKREWYL